MVEETERKSEGPDQAVVEATGDAIVIADAIHALAEGFVKLAESVRRLADAQAGEESPEHGETYLDGSTRG